VTMDAILFAAVLLSIEQLRELDRGTNYRLL
jgi:hypothetical protein